MALNKLKFNSINVTPSAGKVIQFDSGADGFETASGGGSIKFIKKLTASSSGTLSFVDGTSSVVLDSTYKEYLFIFKDIHPSSDAAYLTFQGSTNSGSSYGVTITSSAFDTAHLEDDSYTKLSYNTSTDLAQSTDFQQLRRDIGNDNDQSCAGYLHLFNPSSTTFVKHFMSIGTANRSDNGTGTDFIGGYFNTTSAIDAIQFKMASGNIDAGTIPLYGIN